MYKVGIIGASGYVGSELISLLIRHKLVELTSISSRSFEGKIISEIYENFFGVIDLVFESEEEVINKSEIIFLALPHGLSEDIALKVRNKNKILIDLGADFRLANELDYKQFYGKYFKDKQIHKESVYCIPELSRFKLEYSNIIANPGCYPTSIALGLAPALKNNLVKKNSIIIDSKSGVTGSGKNCNEATHYIERNENLNAYSIGGVHRHIPEIEQVLSELAGDNIKVSFTPHLLPINRGMLSTIYFDLSKDISIEELFNIYSNFYSNEKFIKILNIGNVAKIKSVTHTNYCHISLHKDDRCHRVIICSVIDNMIKGAAGQAIQNMNIRLGIDELEGLDFISSNF